MNGVPMTKQKEFLDSQITSIFKALNLQEIPVKEKHVRCIIIGTFIGAGSEVFWNVVMQNMPLQGNQIVCWKFCYILYKLLRDGHPNTLVVSMKYKSRIKDLGKLWGHLKDGFSPLINNFCSLVSNKIDFHQKNPHFPITLNIEQRELDRYYTNDDAYFHLSTELFDYVEYILKLQASIFTSLEQNNLNSLTLSGQCRVQPLIPCIQEAVLLYDHLVNIMLKLHINLDASLLDGHRQRFLEIFKVLKKFFEEALRLQYLKNLVAIPQLSDRPPNFCKNSHHSSRSSTRSNSVPDPPIVGKEDRQYGGSSLYQESQNIAKKHPSIPKNETDYHRLMLLEKPDPSSSPDSDSVDNILFDISSPSTSQIRNTAVINSLPTDLNLNFVPTAVPATVPCTDNKSCNTDTLILLHTGTDTIDLGSRVTQPVPETPIPDDQNVEKMKVCLENSKVKYDALKQMYEKLRDMHFKLIKKPKLPKIDQELQTDESSKSHLPEKYTPSNLPLTLLSTFMNEFRSNLIDPDHMERMGDLMPAELHSIRNGDHLSFTNETISTTTGSFNDGTSGAIGVCGEEIESQHMSELTSILAGIQGEFDKLTVVSDGTDHDGLLNHQQPLIKRLFRYERALFKNGFVSYVEQISANGSGILDFLSAYYSRVKDRPSNTSIFDPKSQPIPEELDSYVASIYRFFSSLTLLYNYIAIALVSYDSITAHQPTHNRSHGNGTGSTDATNTSNFDGFEMVNMMDGGDQLTASSTPIMATSNGGSALFASARKLLCLIKLKFKPFAIPDKSRENGSGTESGEHDLHHEILSDYALSVITDWGDTVTQLTLVSRDFCQRWTYLSSSSSRGTVTDVAKVKGDEDFEHYLEREISDVFQKIDASSGKLKERLSVLVTMKNGPTKIEDKRLLEECDELIEAVKQLIEKAVFLQKKLSANGLQSSMDAKDFYHKGNKWSQGFISVAKLVGIGVSMFVETVTKMQQRETKYEEIIIFAKEMTKNLAHLIWSAKIRTGSRPEQETATTFKELFKASRKIGDHTTKILSISRSINLTYFEENFEVNLTNITLHQAKFLEIETQIKVLELESQIEKEQSKLLILRKRNYHLPDSI